MPQDGSEYEWKLGDNLIESEKNSLYTIHTYINIICGIISQSIMKDMVARVER